MHTFKSDIDKRVAANTGLTQEQARKATTEVFSAIRDAVANGEEVTIPGFGRFTTAIRKGRTLPKSIGGGGPVTMPDTKVPKFRAFDPLRRAAKQS